MKIANNHVSLILTLASIGAITLLLSTIGYVAASTQYPDYNSLQTYPENGYCTQVTDAAGDTVGYYCASANVNGTDDVESYSANYLGGTYSTEAYGYFDVQNDGPSTADSGNVYANSYESMYGYVYSSDASAADAQAWVYVAWQYLSCADYICNPATGGTQYILLWDATSDGNAYISYTNHEFAYEFSGVSQSPVTGSGGIYVDSTATSTCFLSCSSAYAFSNFFGCTNPCFYVTVNELLYTDA